MSTSRRAHTHSHHHHHHHHGGGGDAHDHLPPTIPTPDNILGAALFYSYILLALVLTGIILIRLRRQAATTTPPTKRHPSFTRPKFTLLIFLALISFTTLSYHMLHVLIDSYTAYSAVHLRPISRLAAQHLTSGMLVVPSPAAVVAFCSAVARQMWQWSVSSTLFVDFAEDLVRTRQSESWSFVALVASLGVMIWMAARGRAEGVKGMGLYFALAQILPVGFTLWLFLLGVLLGNSSSSSSSSGGGVGGGSTVVVGERKGMDNNDRKADGRVYWAAGTLLTSYCLVLQILPTYAGRRGFISLVLAVRVLLGLPIIIPWLLRTIGVVHSVEVDSIAWAPPVSTLIGVVTALSAVKLGHGQLQGGGSLWVTLNDSPAVSALGYDFLIGVFGIALFWLAGGLHCNTADLNKVKLDE